MKNERSHRVVRLIVVWVFLIMLCLFSGCTASFFSLRAVVGEDHTQVETVGIIYQMGFPIWYHTYATGGRVFGDYHAIRLVANWGVWATVFMLICYGLRRLFMKIPLWGHLIGILLLLLPLGWQILSLCDFLAGAIKEHREKVRAVAVGKLNDKMLLAEIAENDEDEAVRRMTVRRLNDKMLLTEIITNDESKTVRQAAEERLNNLNAPW